MAWQKCSVIRRSYLENWGLFMVRKRICFSRSVENHENVIAEFIEKYMFY